MTAQAKYQQGFGPLLPGAVHVPFADSARLDQVVTNRTAAVILEPIQGEGGVRPFPDEFLRNVREMCSARGVLLICDEIQTGMGRTGRLFAFEHANIVPDIVTIAKALGGGVPIGAMLTRAEFGRHFRLGVHGTTYGGNPLVCAAAIAVCETIEREGLVARATEVGAYFKAKLQALCDLYPAAVEVRGRGLMLGFGLKGGAGDLYKHLLKNGVIANAVGDKTIRLVPPLIISREEIDVFVDRTESWLAAGGRG